ncbi:MAG: hypothetical protein ABL986_07935 [Vicinamibacterales bacterium]
MAIIVMMPTIGRAQSGPQQGSPARMSLAAPANLTLGVAAGTGDGGSSGTEGSGVSGSFVLDASTKDKVGTAAISWGAGQRQVQIAFSSPVGSSDEATPISLTGLPSGAKTTFSFNRLNWRGPSFRERDEINDLCERLGLASGRMSIEAAQKLKPCDGTVIAAMSRPDDLGFFHELSHTYDIPWVVGGEVSASRVTQKFIDATTLVPDSQSKTTWNASGRVGAFKAGLGFFLASYSYGESLEAAGTAKQICRPLDGTTVTGAVTCSTSVIGRPTPKTTSVVSFELRRFVSSKFAWSPSLQYDFKKNAGGDNVYAVEVPIYFLTTVGTATPTGGARFAYRSDKKEVTGVIFIGSAFKLF